jgi:hypothetical protein
MKALDYIVKKFKVDLNQKLPINIPEVDRRVMAQTLAELGFTVGAEVGVFEGEHAEILCKNIPGLELYCVDSWIPYRGMRDYHTYQFQPAFEKAQRVLTPYNCKFIKKFSMDAVKDFEDKSLDFVYIDANHGFRHVIDDVDSWLPKVKRGGIIFGHDFHKSEGRWQTQQVYYAIGSYAYANRINPWFSLGVENRDLDKGNGVKAWMWIKN